MSCHVSYVHVAPTMRIYESIPLVDLIVDMLFMQALFMHVHRIVERATCAREVAAAPRGSGHASDRFGDLNLRFLPFPNAPALT